MKPKIRLVQTADGVNYLVPFVLITTLFFLWGFAHSILDVLNKHFQDALSISKTHSALIQAVVYGGYFLMAMPAEEIIRRHGYRAGVVTGFMASVHSCLSPENRSCLSNFSYSHCLLSDVD